LSSTPHSGQGPSFLDWLASPHTGISAHLHANSPPSPLVSPSLHLSILELRSHLVPHSIFLFDAFSSYGPFFPSGKFIIFAVGSPAPPFYFFQGRAEGFLFNDVPANGSVRRPNRFYPLVTLTKSNRIPVSFFLQIPPKHPSPSSRRSLLSVIPFFFRLPPLSAFFPPEPSWNWSRLTLKSLIQDYTVEACISSFPVRALSVPFAIVVSVRQLQLAGISVYYPYVPISSCLPTSNERLSPPPLRVPAPLLRPSRFCSVRLIISVECCHNPPRGSLQLTLPLPHSSAFDKNSSQFLIVLPPPRALFRGI